MILTRCFPSVGRCVHLKPYLASKARTSAPLASSCHDNKEGLGSEGSLRSQQIQGRQPSFIEEVEEEKMQLAISHHGRKDDGDCNLHPWKP
jgi:hypothetical protein